ncbi:MAG: endonuclease/exonuclease/phosphatase family protein [Bacteroidota bacterium]
MVFWLLRKKSRFLVSFFSILLGYLTFGSFYRFGESSDNQLEADLKVMSYNVWGFNRNEWIDRPDVGDKIIELLKEEDPDVLCIQEHNRSMDGRLAQYPYRVETPFFTGKATQAIFSKFPIVESGSLDLPSTKNNIIYADVLFGRDTVRFYNIHLQSFKIVPSSATFSRNQSKKNIRRLVSTFAEQQKQVQILNSHRASCSFQTVLCGDFNNTQFSNVYRKISEGLNDSFLEKGAGFGKTYSLKGLPLRIDYILTDSEFEVVAHKNYKDRLSDHYPIMATLRLKK